MTSGSGATPLQGTLRNGADPVPTDAMLVLGSVQAPEAFGGLFDRHAAEVHRYLARRIGAAADDLLAETFLVAFERRSRYDPDRPDARPWLYGIASRLLHRHRRDEVRAYRALSRVGVDPALPSPADGAAARVDADTAVRGLAATLASLAAGDRDVLLLYAWADLGYAEIAEALEIPVGTVRSRLHRARGRLRAALPAGSRPDQPDRPGPQGPAALPTRPGPTRHAEGNRSHG